MKPYFVTTYSRGKNALIKVLGVVRICSFYLLPVTIYSASVNAELRQHEVEYFSINLPGEMAKEQGDVFDWQNEGPLAFIEFLKQYKKASNEARAYTVYGFHRGWLTEDDMPRLIDLLDSEKNCAAVNSIFSSALPQQSSTIGREAAFLIEGFRSGKYPPTMDSVRYFEFDADSILQWWAGFNSADEVITAP